MNEHYGEILYRDETIFVVRKRAGVSVEDNGTKRDLYTELKAQLVSEGKEPDLFIVHRLDRTVEGLLVFALTKEAAANLSEQVKDDRMTKEYLAVVRGEMDPPAGELRNHLGKQGHVAFVEPEKRPWTKEAVLQYETLDHKDDTSLLRIRLQTGRFHQIRVQLSYAGCPIAGDKKYGKPIAEQSVPYPCLCAYRLKFLHPVTGEEKVFEVKPEAELFCNYSEQITRD